MQIDTVFLYPQTTVLSSRPLMSTAYNLEKMIIIKSVSLVKLLGLVIDNQLKFNVHVEKLCSKAKSSVNALQRIVYFTNFLVVVVFLLYTLVFRFVFRWAF